MRVFLLTGCVALLAATGCATSMVTVNQPPIMAGGVPEPRAAPAAATPVVFQLAVAPQSGEARAGAELAEASAALDGTAVFFETDQAALTADGKTKLLRMAEVLRRYPGLKVRIEGNADERGSAAHNYELASRRAEAARDFLVTAHVRPDQVLVISNGEERPLATGHDESNWQLNRRNDVKLVDDKVPEKK